MDIRLDGKVALVTGASTGIGAAIASEFGASGAKVAVHYNSSEKEAQAVVDGLNKAKPGTAIAVKCDVLEPSQIEKMVREVVDRFGRIDILVNNAGGLLDRSSIEEMPDEVYNNVMDLNMGSTFRVSRAVIPHLKRAGSGAIINVTSIAARNGGGSGAVIYAASKAAVSTFTRGLAKELASARIRVNGIAPGIILTPFHDKYTDAEQLDAFIQAIPLGRGAEAKEVAGTALFLASEELSSFVTGEVVEVNGGALMA